MGVLLIGIIFSYLLGSIPTAYILGRIFKKVDIRKLGSGNVGATNALRVLGRAPGITVLILDILKGVIAVIIIGDYLATQDSVISPQITRVILGLSAVIGHNWTIFLNFKGGKGVATTAGVIIGLAIRLAGFKFVLAISLIGWLLVLVLSRMVSLASIITALFFPLIMLLFKQPKNLIFVCFIFSVFIILRHRPNIIRIIQGREPRISFKKSLR